MTDNPEAYVRAIAAHIDGWRSATFGWQHDPDPVIAERNKKAAIQAHATECLRRIAAEMRAAGVSASPAPQPIFDRVLNTILTFDKPGVDQLLVLRICEAVRQEMLSSGVGVVRHQTQCTGENPEPGNALKARVRRAKDAQPVIDTRGKDKL